MKQILITGENSYIGNSFEKWVNKWPNKYNVNKLSVRDDTWKETSWNKYDVLIHVAGIVHNSVSSEKIDYYNEINRDLAFEIAKKAKREGIRQFIFMSTMSVYGIKKGRISEESELSPKGIYGKSKLEAEQMINTLNDSSFKVAIVRPPMVYGKNAPGNYSKLSKLARISPIFPKINNKRSMIYIDNLSNFLTKIISEESLGIFCPQNQEYVNVQDMVHTISKMHNKNIVFTGIFDKILRHINLAKISKLMDNLYYDFEVSHFELNYQVYDFEDTIKYSEFEKD